MSFSAPIRCVFFDAVGTLLFSEPSPAKVYLELAKKHGAEIEESVVRKRIWAAYRRQEAIDHETDGMASEARERDRWRTIVHETLIEVPDRDACFQDLWDHYARPEAWRLHPETVEVFAELNQRGIHLGLGSNFDARLHTLVKRMPELTPVYHRCLVSSIVGWRKPSSSFFAEVIRLAEVPAESILFVGDDRKNDYEGAKQAGMQALLLDPEQQHADLPERIPNLISIMQHLDA